MSKDKQTVTTVSAAITVSVTFTARPIDAKTAERFHRDPTSWELLDATGVRLSFAPTLTDLVEEAQLTVAAAVGVKDDLITATMS